jgi:demethylmenaquinone methyltransferase/2-methoxy-6-polyprenyl-1,4-benzoquinol methylase
MNHMSEIKPYNQGSKKQEVEQMFDNIAHKYDFLNHFFSLGIDILWRKRAIRMIKKYQPKSILDVATGTGDFAILTAKHYREVDHITGLDLSEGMLEIGRKKIIEQKLSSRISMVKGDSEKLPFEDHSFEALTVAFGVRNFEDLKQGLREMHRVLKPEGVMAIIEFSKPKKFPIKQLFTVYFKHIMPTVGNWLSKDSRAYSYLPESVDAFPEGEAFKLILSNTGFSKIEIISLSGGIASIYFAQK